MKAFLRACLPILAGIGLGLTLLALTSEDPVAAIAAFAWAPLANQFFLGNLLDQASLILLCALGFLLGMRVGVFNLGLEGQAYLGALIAAESALWLAGLPWPLGLICGLTLAISASAILGGLIGLLWRWFGISELISSFLLSSALIPLIDFALSGPLRDPNNNLLASPPIPTGFEITRILPSSSLNFSLFCVIGLALLLQLLLNRSRWGYEMRLSLDSREFARSQGIKVSRLIIACLIIGAAFPGLAGAFSVYGSHHNAITGITAGIGWSGIAAALIGRNKPLGAIAGALVFAWLGIGAQSAMIYSNLSYELSSIIQGIVFLLVTIQHWSSLWPRLNPWRAKL